MTDVIMNSEATINTVGAAYTAAPSNEVAYVPASDVFTKVYFTKKEHRLKSLVAATLGIEESSISKFHLKPTEIAADMTNGKFCRLDLACEVDGRNIDLEVQRGKDQSYKDRAAYYASKIHGEALKSGEKYSAIPDTVLISILDETLFDSAPTYRSEFKLKECERDEVLTESLRVVFYELEKLDTLDENDTLLCFWLRLLAAKTEEELDRLAEEGDTEMAQIVSEVKEVLSDEEYREIERRRHDAMVNEWFFNHNQYIEGLTEGEAKGEAKGEARERASMVTTMAAKGMNSAAIADLTDLKLAEVEHILAASR